MMGYELELILKKIETPLICILDGQAEEFESAEAFIASDFEKHCEVSTIGVRDGKMVLQLKRLPPRNNLDQPWVKDYIADFGCEPSFF
jgi:hypothetical protein